MAESESKREKGDDMGPKTPVTDRHSKTISNVNAAVLGKRTKACVPVEVLDEIPDKFLPSPVSEFLYGLKEDRKKDTKLKHKPGEVVEITSASVAIQSARSDKRKGTGKDKNQRRKERMAA